MTSYQRNSKEANNYMHLDGKTRRYQGELTSRSSRPPTRFAACPRLSLGVVNSETATPSRSSRQGEPDELPLAGKSTPRFRRRRSEKHAILNSRSFPRETAHDGRVRCATFEILHPINRANGYAGTRASRKRPSRRLHRMVRGKLVPTTVVRMCALQPKRNRFLTAYGEGTTLTSCFLRISAPMLSAIRDADALIESRWRCAYRAVVCTWV